MSVQLNRKDLTNTQQMEISVNGPDGATHLILCTGVANLRSVASEIYTFFVGPQLSRRQFVAVITSGALCQFQIIEEDLVVNQNKTYLGANLIAVNGDYDDETGYVKVCAQVSSSYTTLRLAISYNVHILAELPTYPTSKNLPIKPLAS